MIDRKNRIKGASLIREFLDCHITNDEFDEQYPHNSYDPALKNIGQRLWFFWSDLETHRLDGKHALNVEQRAIAKRCIQFLETDLEYTGPSVKIDPLAWLKRGWKSLTRQYAYDSDQLWWPFANEEQSKSAKDRQIS